VAIAQLPACGCACCILAPGASGSVDPPPDVDRLLIKGGDDGGFSDDFLCASKDGFKARDSVDDTYPCALQSPTPAVAAAAVVVSSAALKAMQVTIFGAPHGRLASMLPRSSTPARSNRQSAPQTLSTLCRLSLPAQLKLVEFLWRSVAVEEQIDDSSLQPIFLFFHPLIVIALFL